MQCCPFCCCLLRQRFDEMAHGCQLKEWWFCKRCCDLHKICTRTHTCVVATTLLAVLKAVTQRRCVDSDIFTSSTLPCHGQERPRSFSNIHANIRILVFQGMLLQQNSHMLMLRVSAGLL